VSIIQALVDRHGGAKCLGRLRGEPDFFERVGTRHSDQTGCRQNAEQRIKLSYVKPARFQNLRGRRSALGLGVERALIRLTYDYVEELSSGGRDRLQSVADERSRILRGVQRSNLSQSGRTQILGASC
jgi:hypothetical protein